MPALGVAHDLMGSSAAWVVGPVLVLGAGACSALTGLDGYGMCGTCGTDGGATGRIEGGLVDSNDEAVQRDDDAGDGAPREDVGVVGPPVDAADTGSLATGLVAYYPFDETSGTTAADVSGNGHTATLVGGATFSVGLENDALALAGGGQYVSLPAGIVSSLSSFSVAAWVNLGTVTQSGSRIFDFGVGTNVYLDLTGNSGSGSAFEITASGSGQEQGVTGPAVASSQWQHVAVTQSGSVVTLYVQGVQAGEAANVTLSPALLGNTTENWIGKSHQSNVNLTGQIDNFRIYDRALTAAEVQSLYMSHL